MPIRKIVNGDTWEISTIVCCDVAPPVPHPTTRVFVPDGYAVTGGGAFALWGGAGSLLTASMPVLDVPFVDGSSLPETNRVIGWQAAAKDHIRADPSALAVFAVGIRVTKNGVAVPVETSAAAFISDESHCPELVMDAARPGFLIAGGGARVIPVDPNGAGALLQRIEPIGGTPSVDGPWILGATTAWIARARDHVVPAASRVSGMLVYLRIGDDSAPPIVTKVFGAESSKTDAPYTTCVMPDLDPLHKEVIAGGADAQSRFLAASVPGFVAAGEGFPPRINSWTVASKDHITSDAALLRGGLVVVGFAEQAPTAPQSKRARARRAAAR